MKDAYYFSHDVNAKSDPKIMAMRNVYGAEGYGWYWIIIEMLAEQNEYKLCHKKWVYDALAMAMQCDAIATEKFITDCINDFELFDSDGEFFWSNSLIRRMEQKREKMAKRSEAGKKGAQKRWKNSDSMANEWQTHSNAIANACECIGTPIAFDSKESKVKESKVNNNNIYVPNGTEEYSDKPDKYKELFDYYQTLGLIKHRKFTKEMRNAIDIARRRGGYSWEELKELLTRHAKIVKLTANNGERRVRPRGLADFFGKKIFDGTVLICSEYADDGSKWMRYKDGNPDAKENHYTQKKGISERASYERPIERNLEERLAMNIWEDAQ